VQLYMSSEVSAKLDALSVMLAVDTAVSISRRLMQNKNVSFSGMVVV